MENLVNKKFWRAILQLKVNVETTQKIQKEFLR